MPAATYRVQAPDGNFYQVDGPPGASDEEVRAEVLRQNPQAGTPKARQEGRDAPGAIQGALTALNGLTMGFGDELAGLVGGDDWKQYVRGAVEENRKRNPIAAGIGEVSGSLLTAPLGAVGAVGRMGTMGRVATTVGTGAGLGALQGAGEAETMADVPKAALTGAVVGGATAGALSGGATVLKNARDQVMPRFSGSAAADLALRRLGLAVVRDEKTGQQVITRMDKLGPEATIADSAGENTRNLLDTMATLPGKTQDQVEKLIRQRQVGRADRMDAIPDALSGGARADDIVEMLVETKKQLAGPLYAQVDKTTIPITNKLAELSDRPAMRDAMEMARTRVANQGADAVAAFDAAALNKNKMPLRFWDDVKKGLDDVIGNIKRGGAESNKSKSTLDSALLVKRELLKELDDLAPVYKEARDAFAGPAALESAIEDGRKALTMTPAEINRMTFKLDQSEQEAFRLGAAEAFREKIGTRSGQTNLLNAPFDRNTRQQMRAIFGDERGYREAMTTILGEGQLKRLERVGRGSQTAGREARMEDLNAGVLDDALSATKGAASGNIMGVIQAARSLGGRLGTPEVVRDEIGRLLMQRGVPASQTLQRAEQVIRSIQMGNSREAAIEGVLGGSLINP